MATGVIVGKPWRDATHAHIAVRVREGTGPDAIDVEYVASMLLTDLQGKTGPEQKELLRLAVKAVRDRQTSARQDLSGISGNVTV